MKKFSLSALLRVVPLLLLTLSVSCASGPVLREKTEPSPRIVNIINFIRELEPRDAQITPEVLYQTVVSQIALHKQYNLPATFLLQYDALIDTSYQILLKADQGITLEVGGWWEITQPHVEAAGITWRGRYPWDWHADVGFATGYTPQEREKLVDIYMAKFKEIFGKYPLSVGSWFIDAHTLRYMHEKYGLLASCNCKDQVGTDGYTLWGGYWNQAYYPSKLNAYMPAQTEEGQIPVPIFRMLGSDPIYQYENGLGGRVQGVESLEPVYPRSGGSKKWVNWFLNTLAEEPALAFGYTQAGQENSFTWSGMQKGLEMQFPIIARLAAQGKIRVETLAASATWFKEHFPVTPATAVSATTDPRDAGRKSVWYNSRFYRTNLFWQGDTLLFRDIHIFDEKLQSDYLDKAGSSNQCVYTTLPLVDGFMWSSSRQRAGLRVKQLNADGTTVEISGGQPVVTELLDSKLLVEWPLKDDWGTLRMLFSEKNIAISRREGKRSQRWVLELQASSRATLPFTEISGHLLKGTHSNFPFEVTVEPGIFATPSEGKGDYVFRLVPEKEQILIQTHR
ncbi:MAG: hypothetical protein AB7C90_09335 [Bacteroidales bacterium]